MSPSASGAVEIALAAGTGGSGTLWIEGLRIEPRDLSATRPRIEAVAASTSASGRGSEGVLDEDPRTALEPRLRRRGPLDPARPRPLLRVRRRCDRRRRPHRRSGQSSARLGGRRSLEASRRRPGRRETSALAAHARWRGTLRAHRVLAWLRSGGVAHRDRAARARGLAGALHRRGGSQGASRPLPASSAERASLLGFGRRRRRREKGTPQRGRSAGGRRRIVLHRAFSLGRRTSRHLGRRRAAPRPSGRPSADPVGRVENGGARATHHGLRRRVCGTQHAGKPLRGRERRWTFAPPTPLPRPAPVSGEPRVAKLEPRGRGGAAHAHRGKRRHRALERRADGVFGVARQMRSAPRRPKRVCASCSRATCRVTSESTIPWASPKGSSPTTWSLPPVSAAASSSRCRCTAPHPSRPWRSSGREPPRGRRSAWPRPSLTGARGSRACRSSSRPAPSRSRPPCGHRSPGSS